MTTKAKKVKANAPEFDYTTIKTFEDACKKVNADPAKLPDVTGLPEEFAKPIIAYYKLLIIYLAINNGWKPNWGNWDEYKYYPWFDVLSSGFGFSGAYYLYGDTHASVGSRLCTDSREKALYIAEQFKAEYQDYFLYSE
jgi:hypothetical protein